MQDDGSLPPLMPDDFAALAALAGPLYQESRVIESYTSNNPIPNANDNYGSMNIKQGLEQAQRLAQSSVVRPTMTYVQPAAPEYVSSVPFPNITSSVPQPIPIPIPTPMMDDQLEFKFNSAEQNITNDLLKEISKKLSKLITLIENKDKGDTIPKSKANVKN